MSEEALQIVEERREVKCKGERERYTQLNATFQRIARRDKKVFLSLPAILWNSAVSCVYLSPSPLLFASLLSSTICKASSENHFALWHFIFFGTVLVTTSCTVLQTFVHSSLGTLSIRAFPLNLLSPLLYNYEGFDRSYTNGLVVFPAFFNVSLNFAIRSS